MGKSEVKIVEVDNGFIITVTEESTTFSVVYRSAEEVRDFLNDYYGTGTESGAIPGADPEVSDRVFFGEYGSYPVIRR